MASGLYEIIFWVVRKWYQMKNLLEKKVVELLGRSVARSIDRLLAVHSAFYGGLNKPAVWAFCETEK